MTIGSSSHDNEVTAAVIEEAGWWGTAERLELVLVDRGVTERAAQRLSRSGGVARGRLSDARAARSVTDNDAGRAVAGTVVVHAVNACGV